MSSLRVIGDGRVRHGTYADVADEYYDPSRHPTSANFRSASGAVVRAWLPAGDVGTVCDVGAGESLAAEVLAEQGSSLERLTLLDSAPEMLAYSEKWLAQGAKSVVGDAEAMPFGDLEFDLVVASLGDPFNGLRFWREVARVLRPGGHAIFTTPSFEWADTFRGGHHAPPDAADFLLRDGSHILVPSVVLQERAQIDLVAQAGLSVIGVYHVLRAALRAGPISEKLNISDTVAFVAGYLVSA
jgi:SAM-dependent methyltransferase